MLILKILSGIIVLLFCAFLIGLAVMILVRPQRAEQFLRSYASSAQAHYTEQAARLLVGAALVLFAPSMWFTIIFKFFGWIMVVTTIGLLLIPWKWHHKFGEWVIPPTIRFMKIYSLGAFMLGLFILYSFSRILFS